MNNFNDILLIMICNDCLGLARNFTLRDENKFVIIIITCQEENVQGR